MSFGEERCSSYVLIPPQNHDPAARKRRENHIFSALYKCSSDITEEGLKGAIS